MCLNKRSVFEGILMPVALYLVFSNCKGVIFKFYVMIFHPENNGFY